MGRINLFAKLAFVFFCLTQSTWAQRPDEAIRNAQSLLSDTCKLHQLLESAGAEPFTLRSACRLESSAEELVEKLSCPSSIAEASVLVDDCILWYKRTSVGVRRQSCLASDRAIATSLACTGRQLTLVETSVSCLLRHGTHNSPNPQPSWNLPQAGRAPSPYYGQALPGRPGAWVEGPFSDPAGSPALGPSPFGHPIGNQYSTRESHYRQQVRDVLREPAPSPAGGPRGQIARAVLELMLSEMSRSTR